MKPSINLAYYNEKDWERFLETIDDKKRMPKTWNGWHKAFLKAKMGLISRGFIVNESVVEIEELQNYCKMRGIKNDGKARSQFVLNK